MKLLKALLFNLIFVTACGVIRINENDYYSLNASQKKEIKSFEIELVSKEVDNTNNLVLYEINTNDILNCTRRYKYTWVHLWRPYCTSESCKNIKYYLDINNNHKMDNLELLLISESYDINSIKTVINNSIYTKPIYVLQDAYYGHKQRLNRLKLFNELKTDSNTTTKIGFDDYLFQDSLLIFMGYGLNESIIDSIIKQN